MIDPAERGALPQVTASAPGKLVLLGEYAVLEGAPAIVMAVNRRASAALFEHDGGLLIEAPSLGISGARGWIDGHGHVSWPDSTSRVAGKLHLAGAVMAAEGAPHVDCRAVLDTAAFFDGAEKLGLGSSAAMSVALAGAIRAGRGEPFPRLRDLLAIHRANQGGRGSGVDIAASLAGGAIVYRLHADGPRGEPVKLPAALEIACVWSGRSASTGDFLRRVEAWREREPRRHSTVMNDLKSCASAGAMAMQCGDAATAIEASQAYARGLAELGRASGADIVSAEHVKIGAAAKASGLVYKTCGAGGGDIGVALTTDPDRIADFRRKLEPDGFGILDLALDPDGLRVE